MIKKFEQYNESVRDSMKPKSASDINSVIDGYIKKMEKALNNDPYDNSIFTAENFVNFISDFYGCNDTKDIVNKLIELEYINADNTLSEWIDGVDSVSSYSDEDGKEQLKNFLETIKELK